MRQRQKKQKWNQCNSTAKVEVEPVRSLKSRTFRSSSFLEKQRFHTFNPSKNSDPKLRLSEKNRLNTCYLVSVAKLMLLVQRLC